MKEQDRRGCHCVTRGSSRALSFWLFSWSRVPPGLTVLVGVTGVTREEATASTAEEAEASDFEGSVTISTVPRFSFLLSIPSGSFQISRLEYRRDPSAVKTSSVGRPLAPSFPRESACCRRARHSPRSLSPRRGGSISLGPTGGSRTRANAPLTRSSCALPVSDSGGVRILGWSGRMRLGSSRKGRASGAGRRASRPRRRLDSVKVRVVCGKSASRRGDLCARSVDNAPGNLCAERGNQCCPRIRG